MVLTLLARDVPRGAAEELFTGENVEFSASNA